MTFVYKVSHMLEEDERIPALTQSNSTTTKKPGSHRLPIQIRRITPGSDARTPPRRRAILLQQDVFALVMVMVMMDDAGLDPRDGVFDFICTFSTRWWWWQQRVQVSLCLYGGGATQVLHRHLAGHAAGFWGGLADLCVVDGGFCALGLRLRAWCC
jgi:hypothetical protein